jgi:hypothetical protein
MAGPSVLEIIGMNVRRSAALTIAILGFLLLVASQQSIFRDATLALGAGILALAMILSASILELYRYLQDVRRRYPTSKRISLSFRDNERFSSLLADADERIAALQLRVEELVQTSIYEDGQIPEQVTEALLNRAKAEATDGLIREWSERFGQTNSVEMHLTQIRENIENAVNSLENEIDALKNRANVQMATGAVISIFGFIVLGVFIYWAGDQINLIHIDEKSAGWIALRISLVVMIELFAFFFFACIGIVYLKLNIFRMKYPTST